MPKLAPILQQGAIVSHIVRLHHSGLQPAEIKEDIKSLNQCFASPLRWGEVSIIYRAVIGELIAGEGTMKEKTL